MIGNAFNRRNFQRGVFTFFLYTMKVLFFPLRLFKILTNIFIEILNIFFQLYAFITANIKWIVLFAILFLVGYLMLNYHSLIISRIDYVRRCIIYAYWIDFFRDLFLLIRDIYNRAICWTNAIGLINRVINLRLFVDTMRRCDIEPKFHIFDLIRNVGFVLVNLIQRTLIWCLPPNFLYSAYPGYPTLLEVVGDYDYYEGLTGQIFNGLVCLCEDLEIIFLWASRILAGRELPCIGHQVINGIIGIIQTIIEFVLDFLTLLLSIIFGTGTVDDVVDIILGTTGDDQVIPNLSKTKIHERFNAAAVYAAAFLNKVFLVSYCTFTSELDSKDSLLSSYDLYDSCVNNPDNQVKLFGALGPGFAAFSRFIGLQSNLLWHIPQILFETFTQPAGPRYIIDVWYGIRCKIVFDTVRFPNQIYNYSESINFPTPSDIFINVSIEYPNEFLYGPPDIVNCNNTNNSKDIVPCEQCPKVAELPIEFEACVTARYLDNFTQPLIGFIIWEPIVCCGIVTGLRVVVAGVDVLVGLAVHVINYDLLLNFITDYNLYNVFFDEIGGRPREFGGFAKCISDAVYAFDNRLLCLGNLFAKPIKATSEAYRLLALTIASLINTIAETDQPGIEDYVCVTSNECIRLEDSLSSLRRPRQNIAYDPTFQRQPQITNTEPAFIDCVCYWLNFNELKDFLDEPPDVIPDFCCLVEYYFRFFISQIKIIAEAALATIETVGTIFDPNRNFTIVVIEWASCKNIDACIPLADIIADGEDFINCPCIILPQIDALVGISDIFDDNHTITNQTAYSTNFFCVCDFLSAFTQFYIFNVRALSVFLSSTIAMLDCLGNGAPTPECTEFLHDRLTIGFLYIETAQNALAGIAGSFGCVLGLPWQFTRQDCLGTVFTWFPDHPRCSSSLNSYGPGLIPCTMSDRLNRVFFYVARIFLVIYEFAWRRVQLIIDIGFGFLTGPGPETTISGAIVAFFLDIQEPIFGLNAVEPVFGNNTFQNWPNYTGINTTKIDEYEVDDSNSTIGNWTYRQEPTLIVYNQTFSYITVANATETTGLVQAIGLMINCLLGLPTEECQGPMLFEASDLDGTTGCLGDLLIAIGNALRDVWSVIIRFIGNGLLVLEYLFSDPSMLGEALVEFIKSFFEILIVVVQNASILVDAFLTFIVEGARFFFGNGIAEVFNFFLNFISKVIDVFIVVVEFLLAPFIQKRFASNEYTMEYIKLTGSELPYTFQKYYTMGFDHIVMNLEIFVDNLNMENISFSAKREYLSDNDNTVVFNRLGMYDFNLENAKNMTDDTLCKEIMIKLNHLKRFEEFALNEKVMWKTCFFLYSLPNEIYGYSEGSLKLEPDLFYNPAVFLKKISGLIQTWNLYTESKTQQYGSTYAEGGAITDFVQVPQSILDYLNNEVNRKRNSLTKKRHLELYENYCGIYDYNNTVAMNECFDKIEYDCLHTQNPLCSDFEHIYENIIVLKEELTEEEKIQKRSLIDALSGSSIENEIIYRKITFNDPIKGKFNPLVGSELDAYASLNGYIILNISEQGYVAPVVNGKIAVTRPGVSFIDNMKVNGLYNEDNVNLIAFFEKYQHEMNTESYMKLHAKANYLNFLLTERNRKNVYDPDRFLQRFKVNKTNNMKRNKIEEDYFKNEANKIRLKKWILQSKKTAVKSVEEFLSFVKNKNREVKKKNKGLLSYFMSKVFNGDNKTVKVKNEENEEYVEELNEEHGYYTSRIRITVPNKKHPNSVMKRLFRSGLSYDKHLARYIGYRNERHHKSMKNRPKDLYGISKDLIFNQIPDLGGHFRKLFHSYLNQDQPNIFEQFINIEEIKKNNYFFKYKPYEFDFEITTLEKTNRFSIENGVFSDNFKMISYTEKDIVYVLFDEKGLYKTYKTMDLKIVGVSLDKPNIHNKDPYVHEDLTYFHPYHTNIKKDKNGKLSIDYYVNYYEFMYNKHMSSLLCAGNLMWSIYVKVDTNYEKHTKDFIISYISRKEYVSILEDESNLNNETSKTIYIFPIHMCFRRKQLTTEDPNQAEYGDVLKGKTIFEYHRYLLRRVINNITSIFYNAFNVANIVKKSKDLYIKPHINTYKETVRRGETPGLNRLLVAYENIRRSLKVASNDGDYFEKFKIPNSFLEELGHYEFGLYDNEKNISKRYYNEKIYLKRNVVNEAYNICLPTDTNAPDGGLTTNCDSCLECQSYNCQLCNYCYNCTQDMSGNYTCSECGDCKISTAQRCYGVCTQCTGCEETVKCLNCKLVQEVVARVYEIINFCIQTEIYMNYSVIPTIFPPGRTQLYEIIYYDQNTTLDFVDYGFTGLINFLADGIFHLIGLATGVDVIGTVVAYFSNTNTNHFSGYVGFLFTLIYDPPITIPFISRCDLYIHVLGLYGTGLEEALKITAILFAIIFLLIFLNFGWAGSIFSFAMLPVLFGLTVAKIAWNWNISCISEPFFSLLSIFGFPITLIPILPYKAANETFAFLDKIITPYSDLVIPEVVIGDYFSADCNGFVQIVDCGDYGFYSPFTVIGYIGQRYLPEYLRAWLVDYLNTTVLVRGLCVLWDDSDILGPLYPFFEVNFDNLITNSTTLADQCFYYTSLSIFMVLVYLIILGFIIFILIKLFLLFIQAVGEILALPPISWFMPW